MAFRYLKDPNLRILVVDDFASQRGMVKHCLKELDLFNIVEARDGESALDVLRRDKIGLVISDWTMPKMSGIEFLREVRGNERWKDIPFLMITAEAERSMVLEAIQAGVSNFIAKPFNADDLEKKIDAIFMNLKK